ncbi:hypothetical protein [Halomonas saccharevitans]|uniref:Uncharacterized protein n=1 Tax=Halomonas saccharevitans TaxID=416872 RepID=A0A1I7CWN7_9GAMM|nr:hypothetical protein [Halomonas saccharevitans]SFU03810.1 hypothetical protein SAMN04487956_1685 [Halomonas saccharevitans]
MPSPYWLLPAFLLLSYELRLVDTLGFHAALACVPLAALAGDRLGWRGVGLVALGGLLLPVGLYTPIGGFPARLDIYLVSLALAALLATRWPVPNMADTFHPSAGFFTALALLPLHVLVAREGLDSGVEVVVIVSLLTLLFFLLFLLGWALAPPFPVLAPLGLATVAGIALALLDGTVLELPRRLHYRLDTSADFLTGAACFLAGRYARLLFLEGASDRALPRRSLVTLALLLALWGGYPAWLGLVERSAEYATLIEQFTPVGSALALPLAALLAGWRYRWRGIAGLVVIAAAVETAGAMLAWGSANLGTLVVAFAFGALGNGLRDRRDGTHTAWPSGSRAGLFLAGVVSLPLILGLELGEARDLAILALGVAALLVLPFIFRVLLRRAGLWLSETARRGWMALTGLVLLILGLLPHLQEALIALGAVLAVVGVGEAWGWRSNEAVIIGLGVLVYLAMLLTAVAAILRRLPDVLASGRELSRWWKARREPDHPMATEAEMESNSATATWLPRLARGIGWIRNALLLAAVGMTLMLLLEEFFRE